MGDGGKNAVLPEVEGNRAFTPSTSGTLVVALMLGIASIILLFEANYIPLPKFLIVRVGAWACACVFSLRVLGDFKYFGIFKKVRKTKFSKMDTFLYMPLCAFLSFTFIMTIINGG
ncbi:DUF3995 domain-containing protein [Viridibacillus sp. NPDC096237]|uniref:DUF3995 domain-containing protein n=1 Tax=Viridibacillus sp. NPDC096237 TaxID=3390721 RepID=UPI003CFC1B38